MLLTNIRLLGQEKTTHLSVSGDTISWSNTTDIPEMNNREIDCNGALVFPGLINSHDHLDFNCFPVLSNRSYKNYTEWGNHIHAAFKYDIDQVLKIPKELRSSWGVYKNLLAGVTTVVNHGEVLSFKNPLIAIYQQAQSLHSVKFQKNWKWLLNNPLKRNQTCVIHSGEGIDKAAANEIDELLHWNLLKRPLVGIHGIAMNQKQAPQFKGMVWCPYSNRVLFDAVAPVAALKHETEWVLGTDSTLSAHWNIWEHLRLARQLKQVSDQELIDMVTVAPARLWNLQKGKLSAGMDADIVVSAGNGSGSAMQQFFSTQPEDLLLVIQKGRIRLFDSTIAPKLDNLFSSQKFTPVSIKNTVKFIEGDLPALMQAIRYYNKEIFFPCKPLEAKQYAMYD